MNKRQEEIITYLYRFRFLTRFQLQSLMQQKYYSRLVIWLNDLTKNNYIKRFYYHNLTNSPAIYSIDNQGRKYLKDNSERLKIKTKSLDKVWRDEKLTTQFRFHCLTLADVYVSLLETSKIKCQACFFTLKMIYKILISNQPSSRRLFYY